MSALGHQRTYCDAYAMSALPPKADIRRQPFDIGFGSIPDIPWALSDGADDTKPEECKQHHCQLHVGNYDPPAVLLIESLDAGISR
jgi:hypothetical protein